MAVWVKVPRFPGYEISDSGEVRSFSWQRKVSGTSLLTPHLTNNGYLRIKAGGKRILVHRLVCEAFHGPAPTPLHEAAHWNGARTDNRADNLRWATRRENEADKKAHGTLAVGARHGRSKLDDANALAMRAARRRGETYAEIARRFGVSFWTARRAVLGISWKHLEATTR